jgi:outer membrane protein
MAQLVLGPRRKVTAVSFFSEVCVHRLIALLLLCILGCTSPAWSQADAQPLLTLDQAIAMAIDNNRRVKIKALDVAKADHDLAALKTRRLPNFDLRTLDGTLAAPMAFTFQTGAFGTFPSTGPIPFQDTSIRAAGPRLSGILFAQVAQPLTQLRAIGFGVRALEVGRDLAREQVRAEQQVIAHNVRRLFYGLFEAQGGLAANEESLTLYRELDRLVSEYVERQVALPAEGLTIKTALAKQELASVVLRNTIATLKEQLNLTLGRDLNTDLTSVPPAMVTTFEADLASAQSAALEGRPEVREARLKVQQADFDLQRTKAAAIPEVSAAFNYVGFYNFEVLPKNVAVVGVLASWEPWDWGRKREEAAAKTRTLEQARLAVKEAEDSVRVDVSEKFRKVQEARAMLRVLDLGQQTAREQLRVAIEQNRQQVTLQRRVLEAQAASADADQQYRSALAAFWTARADFERAIGGGQ